jgi:hypothetical protein
MDDVQTCDSYINIPSSQELQRRQDKMYRAKPLDGKTNAWRSISCFSDNILISRWNSFTKTDIFSSSVTD